MTAKPTFATFESSGGARVHRLPLEVFPHFWAYVYVLQKDEFCILIDAGSGMDSSHQHLLEGLQLAGLQPSDLSHILLTHAHIDHYGGLSRLRPLTRAMIGVNELDVQTVAHHEARLALISKRLAYFLAETGLAEEQRDQLLSIYRFTKAIYQSVPVDFTYEAAGMKLGAVEIIHLPGHCPGHVALRLDDIVFCGDMVVEGVTPHLSPESINPYSGLDHYLDSLAHLQTWARDARLVLNGHNDVITDLPAQIRLTKDNILRRMSKGIEALGEPHTLAEICTEIYGETNGYNQLLVIEKTGAYVEYLYEYGMIEITNPAELEMGLPARYRNAGDAHAIIAELGRILKADLDIRVNM
ncbi:MAG TPA: MBL fold metallo-hydrolase [Anaerolineales bacterium]|nr:MBL fold metallo-hydrolase [Anaerolineales bacterium]